MILTILLFLVLLSVLVIAHEWGHFAAARRAGMVVEEFGLGFPPRLFSWTDKKGTRWSVNLIPIGGFVRIQGENGEKRTDPGSFATKSFAARFLVLSGGVIMNVVIAAVLFSIGFGLGLPSIVENGVSPMAKVSNRSISVVQVLPDSPAEQSGIQPGDELVTIDGRSFESSAEARAALVPAEAESVQVVVRRGNDELTLKVVPTYIAEIEGLGAGVALVETGTVRYPWYYAPVQGTVTAVVMTWQVISALGGLLIGLVSGGEVAAELSGPVGIAVLTGQVAELGLLHLVQFAAMLSINLAVLNALPIPALDGGRILFLLVEAVRRKPLSFALEQGVHTMGFVLLIALVIFVTYRDIANLF